MQHSPVGGLLGDGILQVLNIVVEARRPLHEHSNTQSENMNMCKQHLRHTYSYYIYHLLHTYCSILFTTD